ncbi:hypothetical protein FLONG3_7887 [Fusarium longipes]|uniref:Uncharacterized protein n=1 Tax=Fusarium longipes TaxID=694270 RepID=A0A395SA12_9HYPO|nr:hypothetical protein FLONG3_7887 [Fusarium longipes]
MTRGRYGSLASRGRGFGRGNPHRGGREREAEEAKRADVENIETAIEKLKEKRAAAEKKEEDKKEEDKKEEDKKEEQEEA